jgi:site-specific DNA recombinase
MERPGLKRLMADIKARKIDTVVVYKVDRLSRSLADFAKMVEAFDARGVSFVSVTQQFNTTTSMGRLTLNVLLSFAQFEREVTGERIRDKIAASKRKGMWMGGMVPLGYDIKDRQLIVNENEAEQVREIFRLYLELGCVKKLKAHLDQSGARTKIRISQSGHSYGGAAYSRGGLYKILQSRIYVGEVQHRGQAYPGLHAPIIDREQWEKVPALMADNVHARHFSKNINSPSLLRGLLFEGSGDRFTPAHTTKRGKRYRYYVSQRVIRDAATGLFKPGRIPARDLEQPVLAELKRFFASADEVVSYLAEPDDGVGSKSVLMEAAERMSRNLDAASAASLSETLAAIVQRIVVHQDSIEIQMLRSAILRHLLDEKARVSDGELQTISSNEAPISLTVPARLKRCGGEIRLIVHPRCAAHDARRTVPSLIKAVVRAQEWVRLILAGEYKDHKAIAAVSGLDVRYVRLILPCAFLAPEIVEAIVKGHQGPGMNLAALVHDIPLSWAEQNAKFAPFSQG